MLLKRSRRSIIVRSELNSVLGYMPKAGKSLIIWSKFLALMIPHLNTDVDLIHILIFIFERLSQQNLVLIETLYQIYNPELKVVWPYFDPQALTQQKV